MKIMVTGNLGYVGPSVILQLRQSYPSAYLVGMDLGFFAHCLTGVKVSPESILDLQNLAVHYLLLSMRAYYMLLFPHL